MSSSRQHHRSNSLPGDVAYADQNEKDHAVLKRAIRDGKTETVIEELK